jgi:Family of unknown function (DUF5675)
MDLLLQRGNPILPLSQPGELTVDGQWAAWTLENYPDRIPAGRYKMTVYPSSHLRTKVPLLVDVPGRSMIEMHWGTFPQNYEGCIGVGCLNDPSTGEIFQTQKKFAELFLPIEAAVEGEGCWITVLDPRGQNES